MIIYYINNCTDAVLHVQYYMHIPCVVLSIMM